MSKHVKIKCPHCGHEIEVLLNKTPTVRRGLSHKENSDESRLSAAELEEKFGICLGVVDEGGENENGK